MKCEGYDVSIQIIEWVDRDIEERLKRRKAAQRARRPKRKPVEIPEAELARFHALHVAGMSLSEIGKRNYERFGAPSANALTEHLRRTYHSRRMFVRSRNDALALVRVERYGEAAR